MYKINLQIWPTPSHVPVQVTQHARRHARCRACCVIQEACQKKLMKLKRDLQKRTATWKETWKKDLARKETRKKLTKETYKRDLQKRPTIMACKLPRSDATYPTWDMPRTIQRTRRLPGNMSKETNKIKKRPAKETYKRDLQTPAFRRD